MVRGARARFGYLSLALLVIFLLVRFQQAVVDYVPSALRPRPSIPNIVHYVWTQRDQTADLAFEFKHFLSIYSAKYYWQPKSIYIHTNAAASSVARARAGSSGKWSALIFTLPGVVVNRVEAPTHAGNGQEITFEENKTDFIRADILLSMGGVYVDWDVCALRDIRPLRESGFNTVIGRMEGRQLQVNSGTILARKGAKLVGLYLQRMHEVYDGTYTAHSNILLTGISEHLAREQGEVLILDQNAFTPGSWLPKHLSMLYEVQPDAKSNLEGVKPGDNLPAHDIEETGSWMYQPESLNEGWERHFLDSYMIHAFQPGVRNIPKVDGFDHISPRYVLERRSNFARAVYPVVRDMYEKGMIGFDDRFDGKTSP